MVPFSVARTPVPAMQKIIIEKPYQFVPPYRPTWLSAFMLNSRLFERLLRKSEGVVGHECRHVERLRASLDAGHGVLLTPNHCRTADPLAMGWLARDARTHIFFMASWHLFNQTALMAWVMRRLGAFSVNREGVDRQSISAAIEILETAERPLVLFPEGAVSRTNDRLHALLDVAFIARAAAKKRAKKDPDAKVVVHPVAVKYLFRGDLAKQADRVLSSIEQRLSWQPHSDLPVLDRIAKVGHALLCLKELEYVGNVQSGTLAERLASLIDFLLQPLESEWLGGPQSGRVVPRVKALRIKILPDMIEGTIDETERQRRWKQLAAIYLAQQLSSYPPDYLASYPSVDRLLETIEKFEEDLNDVATIHGSLHAIIDIGEAIEVSPERDRKAEVDPLMLEIETRLQAMLDQLARESPLYQAGT